MLVVVEVYSCRDDSCVPFRVVLSVVKLILKYCLDRMIKCDCVHEFLHQSAKYPMCTDYITFAIITILEVNIKFFIQLYTNYMYMYTKDGTT